MEALWLSVRLATCVAAILLLIGMSAFIVAGLSAATATQSNTELMGAVKSSSGKPMEGVSACDARGDPVEIVGRHDD